MREFLLIPLAISILQGTSTGNLIVPRTTASSLSASPTSALSTPTIQTLPPSATASQSQIEEPQSQITAKPDAGALEHGLQQKWHMTTYWSCVTKGTTYTHCGWHEPVLAGGTEIAGVGRLEGGLGGWVGILVAVVGVVMR